MFTVQAASQYLLHRQLFSDMERQQVRDAKKQAEHSKQIQKIREGKESERLMIEQAEAEKIGYYTSSEVRNIVDGDVSCYSTHRAHHMKRKWNNGLPC